LQFESDEDDDEDDFDDGSDGRKATVTTPPVSSHK
jgi:hypothetical protein